MIRRENWNKEAGTTENNWRMIKGEKSDDRSSKNRTRNASRKGESVSAARILENGSLRLTCDAITASLSLAIEAIIEV